MNRVKWERFKFYVLIALILTSLLQVGILWNYQNHGFPYYFFGGLLNKNESSKTSLEKYEFFSPNRIIISEGTDESHWLISEDSSLYTKLFRDAKLYLVDILKLDRIKDKQIRPLTEENLAKLAVSYSVSIEFKANISKKLLAYFLDIKDISNNDITSIKKIVILPKEDPNSNCTIEIVDEVDKKIYKYVLPFQNTGMGEEYFSKLIDDLSKNTELINYKVIDELQIPKEKLKELEIGGDVLFVASHSSKYITYNTIDCFPPEEFEIKDTQNPKEYVDLADTILSNEKDIYIPSPGIYGAAVFKNIDSVYRVYKDGLLEYNYFPSSQELQKGDIADAYTTTLKFISNKIRLITGAKLFLSGVKELKDRYEFKFDYKIGEIPVLFNYQAGVGAQEKEPLKNAITIEVTGDRVINCQWIFKDFIKMHENSYNVDFEKFLDNVYDENNASKNTKSLSIKNIGVCYKITQTESKKIEPAWLIEPSGGTDPYAVNMVRK